MSRTKTVGILKGQIPVSDMSRTATVSRIKTQIPVSDMSRTLINKYDKGPDTSQ